MGFGSNGRQGRGKTGGVALGYMLPQQTMDEARHAPLAHEIFAEARQAEASGFRGVFVSEHHQREHAVPSPLILAAALARETQNVDLGVAVALLPLYHPVRLLEDAACLDVLADGRLILGVGAGYARDDFELYGMDQAEALARYEEGLSILDGGWEGTRSHTGEYYRAAIAGIRPRSVSRPRPRLWVAGSTSRGVRHAARIGDAWVVGARSTTQRAERLAAEYRDACVEVGRAPAIAVIRDAWVADSDAQAHEEIARHVLRTHQAHAARGHLQDDLLARVDPDHTDLRTFLKMSTDRWLIGSPERVAEQLAGWGSAVGASYLIVRFRHPSGPSHDAVLAQIARFGKEFGSAA